VLGRPSDMRAEDGHWLLRPGEGPSRWHNAAVPLYRLPIANGATFYRTSRTPPTRTDWSCRQLIIISD